MAVYPLVLVGLLAVARGRPRVVVMALGGVALVSLALQVVVARDQALLAYYGTHTRLYQLLAGAVLAAGWTTRPSVPIRRAGLVIVGALGCLAVAASSWIEVSASTRGLLATVLAVAIVVGVEVAPTASVARVLSAGPITYLGRISYGTYLWHWPIVVRVRPLGIDTPLPVVLVSGIGGTLLAALSHRLVELPVRRSTRLDAHTIGVTVAGLVIGAVCAVVVVGVPLRSDTRPVEAAT